MRILVLGASGMAGHVIATHLAEQGHDVTRAAGTRKVTPDTVLLDLCEPRMIQPWWLRSFDAVINAVGVLLPDAERDKARTVLLNAWLPHHLARLLEGTETRLVHLSTDCVFSGSTGAYTEAAQPDSPTFYGWSKALGDIVNDHDITLRASIIGPELAPGGSGLFHWLLDQQGPVQGYTKAIWNGVTTLELAQAIDEALTREVTGLYHLTPVEPITKYGLLSMIADGFGLDVAVEPVDGEVNDKTLVDTRGHLGRAAGYDTQLRDLRAWIENHPDLYPHYLERMP